MCILRTLLLLWKGRNSVIHVPHGPNVSLVNIQKKQEENNRTRMALEHRSGSCLHCVLLATLNFTFCSKDSWILDHHLAKASRLTKELHIPWTYFSFPSLKDLSFFHSLFRTALLVSPFFLNSWSSLYLHLVPCWIPQRWKGRKGKGAVTELYILPRWTILVFSSVLSFQGRNMTMEESLHSVLRRLVSTGITNNRNDFCATEWENLHSAAFQMTVPMFILLRKTSLSQSPEGHSWMFHSA